MTPRIRDELKINLCVFLKMFLKDSVKTTNWVGNLQLRSLYVDDLFKREAVVDGIQASVTGNKMKPSVSRGERASVIQIGRICVDICLNSVANILMGVLDISYCDNIKTWMKYCEFWNYDSLLQWLLFPIQIGVSLHGAKILCLDR